MRWRVVTLPRLDGLDYELELHCDTEDPAVIAAIETAAGRAGMWIERIAPSDDWSTIRTPTDTEGRPT
jgi:pyrrolidone-carboxylate peptidase